MLLRFVLPKSPYNFRVYKVKWPQQSLQIFVVPKLTGYFEPWDLLERLQKSGKKTNYLQNRTWTFDDFAPKVSGSKSSGVRP